MSTSTSWFFYFETEEQGSLSWHRASDQSVRANGGSLHSITDPITYTVRKLPCLFLTTNLRRLSFIWFGVRCCCLLAKANWPRQRPNRNRPVLSPAALVVRASAEHALKNQDTHTCSANRSLNFLGMLCYCTHCLVRFISAISYYNTRS
jgi:hypothetical protein